MNRVHRWLCGANGWRVLSTRRIVPWVLEGIDLGTDVLELGPGPGATTTAIRSRVSRVTCLEIDLPMAAALAARSTSGGVRVVSGDAAALPFPDHSFDAVLSFSMLHHVASASLQERVFAEAARVLRPGGVFAGADIAPGWLFSAFHVFQRVVAIDPASLARRLQRAGFDAPRVDCRHHMFRFSAAKLTSLSSAPGTMRDALSALLSRRV